MPDHQQRPTTPIRAVLFDLLGVLLRKPTMSGRQQWEERLGMVPGGLAKAFTLAEDRVYAHLGHAPEAEVWQQMAQDFGLDAAQLRELQLDYWAGEGLDAALVRLVGQLHQRYKTAVISNLAASGREKVIGHYRLDDVLDLAVLSGEVGCAKPEERIFLLAAELLHLHPGEVLFIDDALENVLGAQAIGMQAIQFVTTEQLVAELQRLGLV
ncbi:MAG TPA: HAD-IA family hydrolase [Ktedonobacterales bacterium]|jgi:putative hydrolase of the HAD superfamily